MSATDTTFHKIKILIVEDDDISGLFLQSALAPYASEFLLAISGNEAVEMCRSNNDIDLVLMDIRIPGFDGLEATRRIREFNKDVVIIAQTAFALVGDREKAIAAGCNDHLAKPIIIEQMLNLIRKYVN